uniref:Ig-like domain-containing protein n=1 Tax=Pygocentrus nattereri TaxID=42514 RepID=A0AAR2IHA7_PYGNA
MLFFPNTVSAANNEVSQIPAELFRKSGESADLQCSHSISGYTTILWYKQARNGELQFMGYLTVTSPQSEPEFSKKVKFSGRGDTNGTLTINTLTSNDSAVYFCAAFTHLIKFEL